MISLVIWFLGMRLGRNGRRLLSYAKHSEGSQFCAMEPHTSLQPKVGQTRASQIGILLSYQQPHYKLRRNVWSALVCRKKSNNWLLLHLDYKGSAEKKLRY